MLGSLLALTMWLWRWFEAVEKVAVVDLYLKIEMSHVYRMASNVFEKFMYSELECTFPFFWINCDEMWFWEPPLQPRPLEVHVAFLN